MDLPIPATIHLKCGVSLDDIENSRIEEGSYSFWRFDHFKKRT